MSRKKILILVALILIILGVWIYIAYKKSSSSGGSGTSTGFLGSLFPFGINTPPAGTGSSSGTSSGKTAGGAAASGPIPRLVQISNKLIAGFTVLPSSTTPALPQYNINNATGAAIPAPAYVPTVRFVERGTGYIYDVDALGQGTTKTSGTVIAQAVEAFFGNSGNDVIVRYVKDDNQTIATFLGAIVPSTDPTSDGTLTGNFLADNISDVSVSPDGKNFLTIMPSDSNGDVVGVSMKIDGTGKKQVFTSSFSEWLSQWTNSSTFLTTKASGSVPGYAYLVTDSGTLEKVLGGIDGMTTNFSPDGKTLLYSESSADGVDLHVYNIATGTDTDTGLHTLPEKCVWSSDLVTAYCGASTTIPAGTYPDDWYQGVVHFDDGFWKVDTGTGTTTELDDGEGNYLDATNLALDQKEQYLFFINKNDGSLWSFNLTPPVTPPSSPALPSLQ